MKLNKDDKQAFVIAVLQDVPQEDYDEQAQAIIYKYVREALPPAVRPVWDDPELRRMLTLHHFVAVPGGLNYVNVPIYIKSEVVSAEIAPIAEANAQQEATRSALKAKLTATITSCTTLKQAKERLPEFEKYLPADRDSTGTANLPAVANLVADLVKAGWPKK